MLYTNIKRITKNAFRNIYRNTFLSVATLVVVILTMFSLLAMVITNLITDTITSAINKQVDILVEIKDTSLKTDVDNLINDIKNQRFINKVTYMSKEEVFTNFTKTFGEIKTFWEENNLSNPLPAMIKIEVSDPQYRIAIIDFISSEKYQETINKDYFMSDVESYRTKQIIKITEASKKFITAFTALFLILSILIIFNTIRINIFARKEELKIIKLIGAKYFYMKAPFILEGIIYGIISGIITIFIMLGIIILISPVISNYTVGYYIGFEYSFYKHIFSIPETTLLKFYISNFLSILGFLITIGSFVGAISAYIATYKYEEL